MEVLNDRIALVVIVPTIVGLLSLSSLLSYLRASRRVFNAPLLGVNAKSKDRHAPTENFYQVLKDNYGKYRDSFFKVRQPQGEVVVLPTKYVEELKALPQCVLSFDKANEERFLGNYTLLSPTVAGAHSSTMPKSITQNLTRSLNVLMKDIHEENEIAFKQCIGPCDEWTEVNIFHQLVPIIALISGRVFIGTEISRNPEYMKCIIQYTMEVFQASAALWQLNRWLRPIMWRFVPEVRKVWSSYRKMIEIMTPVIAGRSAALKAGEPLPQDMATWNMLNSMPGTEFNPKVQAHTQLSASMAAIHTTSLTASHVLYDLAARPEYIEPLRKELDSVMSAEPVPWLTKSSTPKLKLLDSFCKESQRMNPLGLVTFDRKCMRDITLHDGIVLPAGTRLCVPTSQITHDPELYPDPDTFDGYRFLKLRQTPGKENLNQFVSTGIDNMNFGYGAHSCPGRFFANNELKVIMTYVLDNYDIKMPEGQGRPENLVVAGGLRPDTSKSLMMRKKRTEGN